jgi:hypothetical protein
MNGDLSAAKQKRFNGSFLLLLLLLGGTLAVLCREGFRPYEVFWANDLPLGALVESSSRLPSSFFGSWSDFYWLGGPNVAFPPNLTNFCMSILSPEHQLKFYVPLSMLFLGFGAWFFFRQLRFAPMVCVLGGLGAGLNMHFFSNACWGLGQWNICCGMIFVALGVLVSPHIEALWLKGVLSGLCTGMAVMEGFDTGAILSIYAGIFAGFLFLTVEEKPSARAGKTLLVGGLMVIAAVLISLSTIYTLVVTQIKGTGEVGQSEGDKAARWQFITQWSIPKLETLRVIIPGVFGYRMQEFTTSTNKAGSYWGSIAEDPRIQDLESSDARVRTGAAASISGPDVQAIFAGNDKAARQNLVEQVKGMVQRRHTGNGEYAGVLVCLLAAFGLASAWRKAGSPFSAEERRAVWFWGGAALFSLLAAWGRYGIVYRLVYHLPFLTNIRSPMKFMHPLNLSLIILSGYGMETLYRRCLSKPSQRSGSLLQHWMKWWGGATGFDKKWMIWSGTVLIAAAAGYLIAQASRLDIAHYLEHNGFDEPLARQIAAFSCGEVGWFVIFLGLSTGLLACVLSGCWAGRRAIWAWVLLCAVMICDLSRADVPWIRYYNYKEKISPNPVVEILRQKPWEHRVVSRLSPVGPYDLGGSDANFAGLCHWWLENDYPFNDIESLEIDQAPRMPVMDSSYLGNFAVHSNEELPRATRLWQLTNTRYIFADAHLTDLLNQSGEPKNSFRTVLQGIMVAKPDITHQVEDAGDMTVLTNSQGTLALIEFTRALPRAKLFSHWLVMDDDPTLRMLVSPGFDPEKTVLLAKDTPISEAAGASDADPGTVEITQYRSKDLILQADAKLPAVLLLNDHTGDFWNVWIDDKPGTVLRCNYIMQGVMVPAGRHTIQFRYQPPLKMLCASLSAFALGILLGGYAFGAHLLRRQKAPPPAAGKSGQPASKAA